MTSSPDIHEDITHRNQIGHHELAQFFLPDSVTVELLLPTALRSSGINAAYDQLDETTRQRFDDTEEKLSQFFKR